MYRMSLFPGGPSFPHYTGQMLAGTGQRCTCPGSNCAKEMYDPKTGYPDPKKLAARTTENHQQARDRKIKGAPMGSFESEGFHREQEAKASNVLAEMEAMVSRLVSRGMERGKAINFLREATGENFYKIRNAEAAAERWLSDKGW